jgi:uncharacterized protein (DUF2147 family)
VTSEGESQIRIFRATNGKYYGRIEWLEEKEDREKEDTKNPDEKLRERKILGIQLLNAFVYNKTEERWENGTIYDPDNGKTYDCFMWFEDDPDVLFIKGYVLGMKFLGRQTKWTRERSVRE